MAKKKKRKYNPAKTRAKIRRESQEPHGKAGPHADKRKRRRKKSTEDYLEEAKEEGPE